MNLFTYIGMHCCSVALLLSPYYELLCLYLYSILFHVLKIAKKPREKRF